MSSVVAVSGNYSLSLPAWGRSFWQDPNDGTLFLAFVSGNTQGAFVTSSDSGITWSEPKAAFPVDDFYTHNNFDTEMDDDGNVHCVYRYNTSGCYTHLGKGPGGLGISGVAVREFIDVNDAGPSRGFNGMVAVYNAFVSDPNWWGGAFGSNKSASIVAVDSSDDVVYYRVPQSGTWEDYPYPVNIFNASLSRLPAGPSGGFPVFTAAGGNDAGNGPAIVWSVNATGITYAGRKDSGFEDSTFSVFNTFPIDGQTTSFTTNTSEGSGYLGRVPFNPNMSFDKPIVDRVHPVLASIDNGEPYIGWDLYSTAYENDILYAPAKNVFTRISQSTPNNSNELLEVPYRAYGYDSAGGVSFIRGILQGAIPIPVRGTNSEFTDGTASDISHGDDAGIYRIYFQTTDPAGQQVISRILCGVEDETTNNEQTKYFTSELFHPASGLRSFAPAGLDYTGGSGLFLGWDGFKALKHPTQPGTGASKQEIVVTAGVDTDSQSRLIIWDFDKSVEATSPLVIPTYAREITKDSGNAPVYTIISKFGPLYPTTDLAGLFDGDTVTNVSMQNGDGFIMEFDQLTSFSRVEYVRNFSSSVTLAVTASLDNVTYFPVATLTGGYLTKHSSEYDVLGDTTVDLFIDPFVAKYLRFEWTVSGTRSISELRLFGYHTTLGKTHTGGNNSSSQRGNVDFENPPGIPYTETFNSVREGELPVGWRVSGDWDWGVQASGVYSKLTGLPTEQPGNGKVKVGTFAGDSIGNGDGFAIRTQTGMADNSSGILEIDISVGSNEVADNGQAGRTISWDGRHYLEGTPPIMGGPEDDNLRFFVVPEFGDPLDGEVNFRDQSNCFLNVCDWYTISVDVVPGNYTLKWIFERKQEAVLSSFSTEEPVAWIDNVRGLDNGEIQGGVLPQTINGVLFCQNVITSQINGYIQNPYNSWIAGYLVGESVFEPIHGYMFGRPDAFDSINGYLLGMRQGEVLGYTLGGEGLRSYPTGNVHGYIATNSGVVAPSVNGYLLGMKQGQIHGYMSSLGSDTGNVQGYLNSDYFFSSIQARLGPSGDYDTSSIHGYLPSFAYESINGYLINNGFEAPPIYGYLSPQKESSVYGYLITPPGSSGVGVQGYLANSGVVAPVVNAWISGLSVFTPINGYLINDGITTQVNGYLNVQDNASINGYMQGRDLTSGQVNAYMSGLGFVDTQVNGYMFGVSGLAQENINGFMIGEDIDTSIIDGYIVGFEDACEGHGTCPLPTVPTGIVIPTSWFNHGV